MKHTTKMRKDSVTSRSEIFQFGQYSYCRILQNMS